ncbi:MAG: chemotaxis protein CheW [bacterium]
MSDNEKKKSSGDKRFGDLFDKSDDEILSYRAKLLAEEEEKKSVEEETIEIIEFVLSYEKYGIESSYIKEVYAMKDFTTVPCTPDFVKGITSLRGEIISIVDIKKFFDLPDKGLTDLNRVLIANNGKMKMGILADRILGVKMVLNNDIKTDLKSIKNISSSYLKGITSDHLIILDIDKILTDPNFIVDQEVE